ncbi:hypothetical protein [Paracraurococcus lichenis]|uniref:Uncharacterized protein n=1 Tax=Paracraurococcus lichenis TaxID=3064888 RepID=A0ABT9E678_9PROT|nr:hypothetical protein [Paracraurococcus sp. LOR1-02]MDO9711663.1 hypothetical protein [Paracraurococcus sp. LOR1-02]
MRIKGDAADYCIQWHWFGGQGAFGELANFLRNIPTDLDVEVDKQYPNQPGGYTSEWRLTAETWRQLWHYIQYDVAQKMRHPVSRAVVLLVHNGAGGGGAKASLWLMYPECAGLIEVRSCVRCHSTWNQAELNTGTGLDLETMLINEIPIKFWDPDFAHKHLAQKPLPRIPPSKAQPAPRRTALSMGGHRQARA